MEEKRKKSKGKIIGISAGAALAVAAIVIVVCVLTGGKPEKGPSAMGPLEILSGGSAPAYRDGASGEAFFNNPVSLMAVKNGLVIGDSGNGLIRGIVEGKEVVTVSGSIDALNGFGRNMGGYVDGPSAEAVLGSVGYMSVYDGKLIFTDPANNSVRIYTDEGIKTVTTGDAAYLDSLSSPTGIATDESGNIYVTDKGNHTVIKIDLEGSCVLFAGVPGQSGYKDGDAASAQFCDPTDIVCAGGAVYVADTGNNLVRKIENGKVTTFAGTVDGYDEVTGRAKGSNTVGDKTGFFEPTGLAYADGILFVADSGNNCIKAILPEGKSVLVFGSGCGMKVGEGENALLNYPTDIEIADGYIYVADSRNNAIRRATIDTELLRSEKIRQKSQEDLKARQVVVTGMVLSEGFENNSYVTRGSNNVPVFEGMRLSVGDIVVSENGNAVIFTIDNDKTIRLEPCSEMRITAANSKQMTLSLYSGAYFFLVENKLSDSENMDFTAGGTTMSIRGTEGYGADLIMTGETQKKESSLIADKDGEDTSSKEKNPKDKLLIDIAKMEKALKPALNVEIVVETDDCKRVSDKSAGTIYVLGEGSVKIETDEKIQYLDAGQKITIYNQGKKQDYSIGKISDHKDTFDPTSKKQKTHFDGKLKVPEKKNVDYLNDKKNKTVCEHIWIPDEENSKAATCTDAGLKLYVCQKCKETSTEKTEPLGHDYEEHKGQAATCTEKGWKDYRTCSRCDYNSYEEIAAPGHDYEEHKGQAATCTEKGWKPYSTCSRCDYTTYEEIAALGHDYVSHEAKAATCTEIGWNAYETCAQCGYTTYEEIKALGHDYAEHDGKEATCTEIGWKDYRTCSRCDYSTYEEVSALGHDYEEHRGQAATCTEKGWKDYMTCSRCNYTTYEETAALGHDYVEHDGQAVTCTGKGWNPYKTCSRCDYTTYEEMGPAGHDYVDHKAKAATCTEKGWNAYQTCSRCDYTTYKEIAAKGHDYADHKAQEATCTEKGWNAYQTCSRCDYTTYKEIAAKGHDYVNHEAKAATCTEKGWNAYQTCSRCDYTTYKEIAAKGHDYADHKAQEATCTEVGWNAYQTCSRCDYTTYKEIAAKGHDYVDHKAQEATCTEIGWDAYQTCSRCDYTTYKEIAAKGHDYVDHKAQEATCTEKGWDAYQTCSRCDYTTYKEIAAMGHDYADHKAQEPTCTEKGWKAYQTCSRCDYTTYTELAPLDHDYVEHEAKNATCTETGWKAYRTCTRCDYSTYEETAALEHKMVHYDAKEATCTEVGWAEYDRCSRCGYETAHEEIKAQGHLLHKEDDIYVCDRCKHSFYDEDAEKEIED